jgi:hypothetical protein
MNSGYLIKADLSAKRNLSPGTIIGTLWKKLRGLIQVGWAAFA